MIKKDALVNELFCKEILLVNALWWLILKLIFFLLLDAFSIPSIRPAINNLFSTVVANISVLYKVGYIITL